MSEVSWLSNIPAQASHWSSGEQLIGANNLPQVRQTSQYTATVHPCMLELISKVHEGSSKFNSIPDPESENMHKKVGLDGGFYLKRASYHSN